MFEQFLRTLDELNRFTEETPSELDEWFEEVHILFIVARGLGDVQGWLKDAKGPNAELMRSRVKKAHQDTLRELRNFAQKAYMLWGVNIPRPKGLDSD